MAQAYELQAIPRERVGKGSARALRREGKIPAVIYGDKKSPESIELLTKDATKQLKAGGFMNSIGTIDLKGEKITVLPRDYQLDPVRDFLLHIDFLRVSETSRITVDVPVRTINEEKSPGLKRGGALNMVRHTVEIECSASSIPDAIVVDLDGLEIGDSVHISAIELPESATPTITDRDFTLITIAGAGGSDLDEEEEEGIEGEETEEGEGEGEGEGESKKEKTEEESKSE